MAGFRMMMSDRTIRTADGYALAARVFAADNARGTVLIVPAMGIKQTFYAQFAQWLTARDFNVVTFDYRGMGLSRRGSLRGFRADVMDWARLDSAAMVDTAGDLGPDLPLYWIGHSLGGQIFPFVPNRSRVAKVITIATGSGYWRENAPRLKRVVWWMWYVAAPVSLKLFGYFPGRRLRKIGDLPYGVMSQWRRWCLDPDYVVGAEGAMAREAFASVRQPLTALSFTDDEYMSARNTESLHGFYVNAPQSHKRFTPEELGARRIGHFGFFRAASEIRLWQEHLLPELAV
jgi:predicted alpha/beta hydrolase